MEREQMEKISQIFNKIIDDFGVETDKYEREDAYFGIIYHVEEKGVPLNEAILDAMDAVYPSVDISLEEIDEIIKSCDDSKEVQEGDKEAKITKLITDLASENSIYSIYAKSSDMEYDFSDNEIARLACVHKFSTDYMRERVIMFLGYCDYPIECADFEEGKYDAYISQLSEDEYKDVLSDLEEQGVFLNPFEENLDDR